MREIKFRVWTGTTMEERVVAGKLGAFYVEGIDPKDTASMSPFNTKYHDTTPIMQYTGITDYDGKEIWEDDIVKVYWANDYQSEDEGEVTANDDQALACIQRVTQREPGQGYACDKDNGEYTPWLGDTDELVVKVIGNIYQNPELLKKK